MQRLLKFTGLLAIGLILLVAGTGVFMLADKNAGVSAAAVGTIDNIKLSSARDFLYAYQPQDPSQDAVVVTAYLYQNGEPVKKSGIPVDFSLSDGRFATLDNDRVYTDEWGTASTRVRSYNSGVPMPSHPFLLSVTATSGGKSSMVTLPITRYISLNGTVTDKKGDPVKGAVVSILYKQSHNPINAIGGTGTSDIDGRYSLRKVPTDIGDVIVYVKKGELETYMPADLSSVVK